MLINIMDLLEAEVDKEIAKEKAEQEARRLAEAAETLSPATLIAENINQAPEADGGEEC